MCKLDDRPVVPWISTASGFPAVAHVDTKARHDHVVDVAEEHVIASNYAATIFHSS